MFYDRVKYLALASLLLVGLAGFGIGHWASASNTDRDGSKPAANDGMIPKALRLPHLAAKDREDDEPLATPKRKELAAPARRREAVIRLPLGTFTKEVDAAPYGSGRLTWTYEEDRVLGLIEANVMGGELELTTEAEISLSSNGTIYGLVTSVRLNHFRLPESGELGQELAEFKPFIGLYPLIEPLINETLMDVPFSYQFRIKGDHLVLSNFRILLAGPNPAGKLGGIALGEAGILLSGFQALAVALEGTYTSGDAPEKPAPKKRPRLPKSTGRVGEGWPKLPSRPLGSRNVSSLMSVPASPVSGPAIGAVAGSLPGAATTIATGVGGVPASGPLPGAAGTASPPAVPSTAGGTILPH